ncbi:unnamed protein product, partial [Mesorhabditis belari]|uniref:Uncharacterized protein n=1 Tax=Mesorhabditis belari TaxID=2138241 RepID=A0AAF3ER77_9BILA
MPHIEVMIEIESDGESGSIKVLDRSLGTLTKPHPFQLESQMWPLVTKLKKNPRSFVIFLLHQIDFETKYWKRADEILQKISKNCQEMRAFEEIKLAGVSSEDIDVLSRYFDRIECEKLRLKNFSNDSEIEYFHGISERISGKETIRENIQ